MTLAELWQDARWACVCAVNERDSCHVHDPDRHPAALLEQRIAEFVENGDGVDDDHHHDGDTELQERLFELRIEEFVYDDGPHLVATEGPTADAHGGCEQLHWWPGCDEWHLTSEIEKGD